MRSPNVDLVEEQARIDRELRELARKQRPELEGLPRDLREVLVCVHEHLFEPDLNVKLVKERCRIRTNNVSSRFRWRIGIGLRDYIESRRMEAADHLLRTRNVGIFDLAMALGYDHETTFYRAFRRHFGCTPMVRRGTDRERGKRQEETPGSKARRDGRDKMQR